MVFVARIKRKSGRRTITHDALTNRSANNNRSGNRAALTAAIASACIASRRNAATPLCKYQIDIGVHANLLPIIVRITREAAAGKVFAAGHGEPGNDLGLAHSFVKATPLAGGSYRFDGRKIFTSLSPAWDWLGVHGLDDSDPAHPKIVHAFIQRSASGHRAVRTWDALGMRATQSDDTILEGAVASADRVIRVLPAGVPDDRFVDGILGAVLPGLAAVYFGVARRAFSLALASATTRSSAVLNGKSYAYKPLTQRSVAEAAIELDSIEALLERVANRWWAGYPQGEPWIARLLAAKQHAVDGAVRVVDLSLKIAGAGALARHAELERLYRDVRAGAFHPPNADASLEVIGQAWLGVLGTV